MQNERRFFLVPARPLRVCAVKGGAFQWVQVPPGDRSRRNVQAVTRVNAEQASKRTMRRPTRRPFRGRLIRLGCERKSYAQTLRRGSGDSMYTRKAYATRETPRRGQG
jgi:hypothetical protein